MSLNLSRRSFMKYTALTAAAIAGAGLFTGCDTSDPYNLVLKKAGELTVDGVTAVMGTYDEDSKKYTDPDITGTTVTFPFKITNEREDPIMVTPELFKVTAASADGTESKKYFSGSKLKIDTSLLETNLKYNASVSGNITVTLGAALASGETITLTYIPIERYNEYSLSWVLTA